MTTKYTVSIDETIKFLNELLAIDPKGISALFSTRVPCNEQLAEHATVQVLAKDNEYAVGILGVLNGLFGTFDEGPRVSWGQIMAVYGADGVTRFEKVKNEDDAPCPDGLGLPG